jgi:hypothetical protein
MGLCSAIDVADRPLVRRPFLSLFHHDVTDACIVHGFLQSSSAAVQAVHPSPTIRVMKARERFFCTALAPVWVLWLEMSF